MIDCFAPLCVVFPAEGNIFSGAGNIFLPPRKYFLSPGRNIFPPGSRIFYFGRRGKITLLFACFSALAGAPVVEIFSRIFCRLHESRRPDGTQLNLRPRRRLRAAGNIFLPCGKYFFCPEGNIFLRWRNIFFLPGREYFWSAGGNIFWSSEGRVSPEGAWGSENPWVDVSPSAEVGGSTGAARRTLAKATSPAGHWWKLADAAARVPP